jgi:hypothetical protein
VLSVASAALTLPATAGTAVPSKPAPKRADTLASRIVSTANATADTLDPYGPEGMNVDAAQSYLASGADGITPHVEVAYIEGGVNWHEADNGAAGLADAMYINWHDTPVPCVGTTVATATMTLNGKTVRCRTAYSKNESDYETAGGDDVTVADWAQDPRVTDANGVGFLNPEDLIAAFSGPGFVPPHPSPAGYDDAISGWDFYNNQNDPATTDASYDHSDDQMGVIHTVCPTCLILPVKAGDEAIDSTEDLAKAWLFAYQSGAKVIVSVTADLGYSTFASQVLSYLDSKGVVVVESSNDFDSADHQGGMFWGNVLPGNGLVPNTAGVPDPSKTLSKMAGPFWTRSDLTSFGVHNMFSVATYGGSTSESTPTLGAVMALVLSEGEEAAAAGEIRRPLTGAEAVQVLREASSEPAAPSGSKLPWPARPGEWNEQYGYGMPDVLTALQDVTAGEVPASPEIDSPAWYTIEDPTRDTTVPVTGTVDADNGETYDWSLQYGLGGDPSHWTTMSYGRKTGRFSGTFGTLDLSAIRKSFWEAPFHLSDTKELTTLDQYDVSFRVTTTLADGTLSGEARRVIDVFHDPTALPGFPLAIGSSGDSQPALVDLQGTGRLDIVFGTANGTIDAIDPATGVELPGWPAHTAPIEDADYPAGMVLGYQPIIADVAVGDLDDSGQLSVVATSEDGAVYVFNSRGRLERGWPRVMDDGVVPPPIPRPALPHERLPVEGAISPPVLVSLEPGPDLDIVQAGWDGCIHAWYPDARPLPGWPVRVTLTPSEEDLPAGYTLEADQKLDTPPAVARFSPSGPPDLVIRSQYTELGPDLGGLQAFPYGFVFAYTAAGKLVPGWPVRLQGTIEDYGSAQEFLTEGTNAPAVADVLGNADGNGSLDDVAVGPVWTPESLIMASGKVVGSFGSTGDVLGALVNVLAKPAEAIFGPLPPTTPMPFTGSGAFGILGNQLSFAEGAIGAEHLAAALFYAGSGHAINDVAAAWPAKAALHQGTAAGDEVSGFPTSEQGQDFLGAPMIAPVSAGGANDLVIGGDSGALDARLSSGAEAPGFPKFTGGWSLYAPSAGDLFGNGQDDLVTVTREGYLFAWSTDGSAPAAGSWWRAFHDEYNSGNLATESRPPGVVRDGLLSGRSLSFVAPGAQWYDGRATLYQMVFVAADGTESAVRQVHDDSAAGTDVELTVPAGTAAVIIRSINAAGLLSNAEKCTSSGEVTVAWPD